MLGTFRKEIISSAYRYHFCPAVYAHLFALRARPVVYQRARYCQFHARVTLYLSVIFNGIARKTKNSSLSDILCWAPYLTIVIW